MRSLKLAIPLSLLPVLFIGCTSVSPVPVQLSCPKLPPVDPAITQQVSPHWIADLQAFSTTNSQPLISSPTNSLPPKK